MGKKSAVWAILVLAAFLSAAQTKEDAETSAEGAAASESAASEAAAGDTEGLPELPPVPALPVEAPASLLSLEIGDSGVELFAQGYWEVSILASGAFGLGANAGASAPTLLFRQVPDLWLSLTILDRWFLEASFSAEGFGDEYAAGYKGGEGDFLREVRVGNKGVTFPDLPFLSLGAGSSSSFGISAYGRGGGGSAHFLLRYDQARRITQTWAGNREVTRTEYNPSEYARGRWFVLPDQNVTNLELYIESSAGTLIGTEDARKYRRMTQDEYSYSSVTGRVDLDTAVGEDRRLLAYYTPMTVPGGGADDEPPFYGRDPETVTGVAAGPALVLYEEGKHEGFLTANRYTLASSSSTTTTTAYVRNVATDQPDTDFTATVLSDGYVQVVQTGADTSAPNFDAYEFRMPFLGGDMDWVYDPAATTEAEDASPTKPAPAYSRVLVVESYGAPGSLVLDETGVLPGSIEVRRNGAQEYGFRYDASSNTVTLDREPSLSDTIEISYLLSTSDRSAGSLAAGLGGIFELASNWRAWTALGLRWGVPGTGYSEAGDATPGSLTLTAGVSGGSSEPEDGEEGSGATYKAEAALAASYRREDAAGYYRVAGMEETVSWTSPFRPAGTWPGTAEIAAVEDGAADALEALFPELYGRFHSAVSRQRVLEFAFASHDGSSVSAVRYVEPVALGDYRSFAFFARKDSSEDATLDIVLEGASAALEVQVPAPELTSQWRRFVLRYGGVPKLYVQDAEGGAEALIASGAPLVADPSLSAGKITIAVEGVTDGSVYVDELHFLDPLGQFSLSGRGTFFWSRKGPLTGAGGAASWLANPKISVRLGGTAAEEPSFVGYLDGSASLGPLNLAASLRQGYSDGRFEDGAYGHSAELPLKGVSLGDSFEYDADSGRFGRRDFLSLRSGGFGLELEQTASYGSGSLEQTWSLETTAGRLLTLTGTMENLAAGTLDLPSGYGEAWLAGFRYLLPALEGASSRRSTTVGSVWKLGGGTLNLTAKSGLLDASSPSPAGSSGAEARIGWSFPAGKGAVEPYYKRAWAVGAVSSSSGFLEDWEAWASDFSESEYLYRTIPFAELFDGYTSGLFRAAAAGITSASYAPEAGVVLGRRYGSRWTDLLVPTAATLALRRELSSSLETVTDALVGEVSASMAAINLFGARGVYRTTQLYSVDEYSQRVSASLSWYDDTPDPLVSLSHTALASFYTSREDNLVAENRFSLKETRDGPAWSERLSLSLTLRPDRTWLGDLVIRLQEKGTAREAEKAREGSEAGFASGFLDTLRTASGRLSEIWNLASEVGRPYAYLERYNLELSESYETRYVVARTASLSARLGAYQTLTVLSGADYWTIGFEITLSARVVF